MLVVYYDKYLNWAYVQNNQTEKVQCNIIDRQYYLAIIFTINKTNNHFFLALNNSLNIQ